MIDLAINPDWARMSPAYAPITDLATQQLATLQGQINAIATKPLDPYTQSHLQTAARRIKSALDAQVIVK